jgi:tetratricopeptide (TPR) repeat protein
VLPKRASGYQTSPEGYANAPYLDMSLPYAAGSLYSTVEDLYLWDRALYLDTLLPAPRKQQLFTPGLSQYAYGWVVKPLTLHDGKTALATVSHNGGINGFSTLLVRAPERRELVVLLDNTSPSGNLEELAAGLFSILQGIKPQQPRLPIGEVVWQAVDKASAAEGLARYRALKATKATEYDFSEDQLNGVGYRLLRAGRVADAIEIFKLNVEMFPRAANPYDSLGEAYLASGNKELALANYRRVLELSPGHAGAEAMIKRIENMAAAKAAP